MIRTDGQNTGSFHRRTFSYFCCVFRKRPTSQSMPFIFFKSKDIKNIYFNENLLNQMNNLSGFVSSGNPKRLGVPHDSSREIYLEGQTYFSSNSFWSKRFSSNHILSNAVFVQPWICPIFFPRAIMGDKYQINTFGIYFTKLEVFRLNIFLIAAILKAGTYFQNDSNRNPTINRSKNTH